MNFKGRVKLQTLPFIHPNHLWHSNQCFFSYHKKLSTTYSTQCLSQLLSLEANTREGNFTQLGD